MKWITRERPKIDRIACPWLIKRFVDTDAEFIYVQKEKVSRHSIKDEAIHRIALIVRGADTHRFDLAEQAAGLWAISAGLSVNYRDDHEQLKIGMILYDALYSWATYAQTEIHTWNNK
jgi:hypothetical protein